MGSWYLFRQNQQHGPYPVEQLRQMAVAGQLMSDDLFCPMGGQQWIGLAEKTMTTQGGSITVDKPGHELDGLTLTIPDGAYENDQKISLSASPIKSTRLGSDVEVISPLISIDNGHDFSKQPLSLTIPITLAVDEFAMAFYYDQKSGELEGIPFTELAGDHITLLTHHFSDLFVAAIPMASLQDLAVDSGFTPGLDDWQFTNYGSVLAPGGHCAGQSATAMFYFTEIHLSKNQPRLFGHFDNNNYGRKTSGVWHDDSWGYRFSSVAQEVMDWDSIPADLTIQLGAVSDQYSLAAFAFAMKLTGEPQFVYISGSTTDANGTVASYGHAVIAYKIEAGNLYVADPNYPGVANRAITFSQQGQFSPYSSGTNAAAIQATGDIPFTTVRYIGKTALFDYTLLNKLYEKMQKNQVGQGYFPDYSVQYLKRVDPASGEETWVELGEDLELTAENTEQAGEALLGKLSHTRDQPGNNRNGDIGL